MKQSDALVDNSKKLEEERKQKLRDKKEFFKEQDRKYKQTKKEMYENVKKRPLLMETGRLGVTVATQKKSGMLAEMKELKKVRDTMRKNGVDPEKFMTAEELDKAEDAAFLEKHGKA